MIVQAGEDWQGPLSNSEGFKSDYGGENKVVDYELKLT